MNNNPSGNSNSNSIFTPHTKGQGNPLALRYIAYFMLFASVIMVILGVYFYQNEDKFLNECKLIKCKVTSIEEKRRGKPIVTFTEVNGNYKPFTMLIEYDPSDEDFNYVEGEIYEVYYYEKDVSKSEVKDLFNNHITSFILLILGFTFMLDFPILLLVTNKIKKRQQEKQQHGITGTVISE